MNNKGLGSKIVLIIILALFTISIIKPVSSIGSFHSVYGFLYINNDEAPSGVEVKLTFIDNPEEILDLTDLKGYYQIDFPGHDWEEGYFSVKYEDTWYIPKDNTSVEILPEEIGYEIDLNIEINNIPPDKPINPQPENNSLNISLNPTLSVYVTDPDNDIMDVSFYDASDDSLIDTDLNVISGDTASIKWNDLTYNTTYKWYAIARDSEYESKSDVWTFTTKKFDNIAPKVSIARPERGLYIFDKKILPRFIRPALIIGKITIETNATDEDSGIEKVEFYINGKLKGNDTSEPFTFVWKRDRIRLFHIFVIKVIAYDNEGATDIDKMLVRKFL